MLRKVICLLVVMTCAVSALPRRKVEEVVVFLGDDITICTLPPEEESPVRCLAAIPKWTFNSKTGACESYLYGGCRGTANLFDTEFDCLSKCNRKALPDKTDKAVDPISSPCLLPKVPGTCRADILAYHFDQETKSCVSFKYTGCKGNANNFNTLEDCKETCDEFLADTTDVTQAPSKEKKLTKEELCSLPPVHPSPIQCLGFAKMWTHNSTSKTCEPYVYGGCGKTENLFSSEDACKTACVDEPIKEEKLTKEELCRLPPVHPSPMQCLGFSRMWTHNSTSKSCEPYIYGGCGKTANLFPSEDLCRAACVDEAKSRSRQAHSGSCLLPVDNGPCFGYQPRFAFKKDKNRCEMFVFGGCQGNKNNFRSAEECQNACGGDTPNTELECEKVSCPVTNNRYLERGCLPVYEGNACCPSSFDCPEDAAPVCHYRGVPFQVGQQIPLITEDNPCQRNCRCEASGKHTGGATIRCNEIFCDWPQKPLNRDCVLVNDPNHCCPSYKCTDEPAGQAPVSPAPTCQYNGKTYELGQYIRTNIPCKSCVCAEGFSGPDGPGCRDIHCLVDNRIGTVPVYTENVCCPTGYKRIEDVNLSTNNSRIVRVIESTLGTLTPSTKIPEQVKSDICLLPKVIGTCRMSLVKFYYDSEENKCKQFLYGGCKGNANRFETMEECEATCRVPSATEGKSVDEDSTAVIDIDPEPRKQSAAPVPSQIAKDDRCLQPKMIGPCRMSVEKYYYDPEKQQCFHFYYGGCKGNSNQFDTAAECMASCSGTKVTKDGPFITIEQPGRQGISTLPARIEEPEREGKSTGVKERVKQIESQQQQSDRCLQPKVIGPCRMSVEKYYYDPEKQQCIHFYFGGCKGNSNQFDTVSDCMAACKGTKVTKAGPFITIEQPGSSGISTLPARIDEPEREGKAIKGTEQARQGVEGDRCLQPKVIGPCRMSVEKYYYDPEKEQCVHFYFGGCKGNANQFDTAAECMAACKGTKVTKDGPFITIEQPGRTGISTLPARIEEPERESKAIKGTEPAKQDVEGDRCLQPKVIGPCRKAVEKFHYDPEKGECVQFIYGGCKGNANQFDTAAECMAACKGTKVTKDGPFITIEEPGRTGISTLPARIDGDEVDRSVCNLPQDQGPCRSAVPSFWYNAETSNCEFFLFGGCHGNGNRFATPQACRARCANEPTPFVGLARTSPTVERKNRCHMEPDVGFCRGHEERFYYDVSTQQCKTFAYGGCMGNANNFVTEAECNEACGVAPVGVATFGIAARGAARARVHGADLSELEGGSKARSSIAGARRFALPTSCSFGNLTLNLGDQLLNEDDPCEVCECSVPPEVTCTRKSCPSPPAPEEAICQLEFVPGQCCPNIACVSANPPSIDVCEGVKCKASEHCEVKSQEDADGNWLPPIGVCVSNN